MLVQEAEGTPDDGVSGIWCVVVATGVQLHGNSLHGVNSVTGMCRLRHEKNTRAGWAVHCDGYGLNN